MSLETERQIYSLEREVERLCSRVAELEKKLEELEKRFGKPGGKKPVRKRVNLLYSQFNNDLARARDHAKLLGDGEAARVIQEDMDRIENS